MSVFCPNIKSEAWLKHTELVGNDLNYLSWIGNKGFAIQYTSKGKVSSLYSDLVKEYKDEKLAAKIKALTFSKSIIEKLGNVKKDSKGEYKIEDVKKLLTLSKQGVDYVFESTPELANQVHEALGFKQNNKITDFSDTEVKEEVYHSSTTEFSEFKQGKDGAIHFGDKKAATERTNKSSKKYLKKVKLKVNNLIESVDSVDFEGTRKDKESINYIVSKSLFQYCSNCSFVIFSLANKAIRCSCVSVFAILSLSTI